MNLSRTAQLGFGLCLLGIVAFPTTSVGDNGALTLNERFSPNLEHHVSTRTKLSGELLVPTEKDKPPKKVGMRGEGAIEYDERILASDDKETEKALRIYRQIDFQRTIGDRDQGMKLRPEVARIVAMRSGRAKNSFSPDGPLTWGEIDLLRTDIFTPALAGLLPVQPVKPGDKWKALDAAAIELTDLEKVDEGALECRFEETATIAGRRVAHIRVSGTLRGVNEDGPNRQVINGTLYFDLESNFISYLSIRGEHHLLDKDGQTAGKVEGLFVLTRSLYPRIRELTDDALRRTTLVPNADNTLLLYDNAELGVRFLYPRRWRVGRINGPQLTLDDPAGNGILLTVESLKRIPSAAQYVKETSEYLTQQKAKILAFDKPQRLNETRGELDRFSLGIDVSGQKVTMEYFVARQEKGGATIAARLLDKDREALQREVERLARSVVITREFGR